MCVFLKNLVDTKQELPVFLRHEGQQGSCMEGCPLITRILYCVLVTVQLHTQLALSPGKSILYLLHKRLDPRLGLGRGMEYNKCNTVTV